jgi:uncharacterized protein (DUF58 family)
VALALGAALAGLLGRRPDVVVLAVPFAGAAAWGAVRRPRAAPAVELALEEPTVFEGQVTAARVEVGDGDVGDVLAVCVDAGPWVRWRPASGTVATAVDEASAAVPVPLRAVRWGRHSVWLTSAAATSFLGAYRTGRASAGPVMLTTLPLSAEFDAVDAMPRPAGLVGLHRANRQGSGSEPAEVRQFRTGDRLRRINWRVSSRTGLLHVTSTWSDRDTHVLLLLDTEVDIGRSDGVDGLASSLDTAVRAAAAIGEHFLRAGDRVGLIDLGRRVRDVPVGGGRRQLRRLLDALVLAEAGPNHRAEPVQVRPTTAGALVIALTPLVGQSGQRQIGHLVQHGHTVVVVDTMPERVARPTAPWTALAARVRTMERAVDIDHLGELGVPVVHWRGRGTLDEVLRDVSRLALAPRVRR